MNKNQTQVEYAVQDVSQGSTSIGAALLTTFTKVAKRIRCRAFRVKSYHIGMEINGVTLLSVRPTEKGAANRNPIATVYCSKCGTTKDIRMDSYLHRNKSCGCGEKRNRDLQIEKVIDAVEWRGQSDDLAMAMEIGQLNSKGSRGSYKASIIEIGQEFRIKGVFGSMAMARIQRRWAVATWIRLGAARLERTAQLVLKHGLLWVTHHLFNDMKAIVHVAVRWVLQGRPNLATLQYA